MMSNDERSYTLMLNLLEQMRRNAGYLARAEIERLLEPLRLDLARLEPYGYKVYSQNDEDGILHEIFRRLEISRGTFCEIGVENGLECNTLYLVHQGWRGGWIEGDENQRLPIQNRFGSLMNSKRLALGIGFIAPDIMNSALNQVMSIIDVDYRDLDFLSIDIDGNDIYLLEAMDCSPKVICIEYNGKFPPPVSKKPVLNPKNVWRGGDYMGSSLVAIDEVARNKGYTLVGTNIHGGDAFYVRNDLTEGKFVLDSSPANLYNPPRYWLTFDHFRHIGHHADFGPYTDLEG